MFPCAFRDVSFLLMLLPAVRRTGDAGDTQMQLLSRILFLRKLYRQFITNFIIILPNVSFTYIHEGVRLDGH